MAREVRSPRRRRRKCCICRELFLPDARNHHRQRACSKTDCQKARKKESQRRWLAQPKNQDHFRGSANTSRVQDWRKKHPGYWKNRPAKASRTLQDACPPQPPDSQSDPPILIAQPLQDLFGPQSALLVGLISRFTGSTLQDDIVESSRKLILTGYDILGLSPGGQNSTCYPNHEGKETVSASAGAPSARSVQLGRSSPGA